MRVGRHQVALVLTALCLVFVGIWAFWSGQDHRRVRRVVLLRSAPFWNNDSFVIEVPADESYYLPPAPLPTTEASTEPAVKLKRILYWTPFNSHVDFMLGFGRDVFRWNGCKVDTCETTNERALLQQSDAVVVHLNSLKGRDSLPPDRDPNQVWVLVNGESPHHSQQLPLDGVFNLTMTYRRDAEIPFPKGKLIPTTRYESKTYNITKARQNFAKKRPKLAAWYVNLCNTPSLREKFVKELQKYMLVDVYGACGTHTCRGGDYDCDSYLVSNYKFYFSFEKSLCRDYITESLWRPLSMGAVPVVLGAGDYAQVLPPHSYIDVKDFKSVKHLADYLLKLDRDDDLYNEYFRWRSEFKARGMRIAQSFCDLCEYIHKNEGIHKPAVNYPGRHSIQAECVTPRKYFAPMRDLHWLD